MRIVQAQALIVARLLAAAVLVSAQSTVAQFGTWELDVAKSRFNPGPPPRQMTRTFESLPDGRFRYTSVTIDSSGKSSRVEYVARFDGVDYPVQGSAELDSISLKPVDSNSVYVTQKRKGQVQITGTRTISADGRTATVTNKGTDSSGRSIDNVLIFVKQ